MSGLDLNLIRRFNPLATCDDLFKNAPVMESIRFSEKVVPSIWCGCLQICLLDSREDDEYTLELSFCYDFFQNLFFFL